MYCVIQELETKKPNKQGHAKELISKYCECTIMGKDTSYYYYTYSSETFERPIKKAYRISIHESYREKGKVKKRQYVICTVNYYDIADGWFSLYDYGNSRIEQVAETLHQEIDTIYQIIEEKLAPLEKRIKEKFSKTEEYKTHQEHERITTIYAAKKAEFNEKYEVTGHGYDECYDVFGVLQNEKKLKQIQKEYKDRKRYEKQSRSYYEKYFNNYKQEYGSYYETKQDNYNKEILKQFYRVLSKKFHPDANPKEDTSEQMKILNQLKKEWGV